MWHNSFIPTIIFYGKVLICNKRTPGFQFYFTAFKKNKILLVLQLCYLISVFLQEKASIQLLLEMQWTFLQDRCADDYCKKVHTCSCLSAFSIIISMAFAFTLSDFRVYRFVVYKNQLLLFLFHICWILLPRFFRNVRKRWKILHILEPNRPAYWPWFYACKNKTFVFYATG